MVSFMVLICRLESLFFILRKWIDSYFFQGHHKPKGRSGTRKKWRLWRKHSWTLSNLERFLGKLFARSALKHHLRHLRTEHGRESNFMWKTALTHWNETLWREGKRWDSCCQMVWGSPSCLFGVPFDAVLQ